jgi:hypothetical protein
VIQVLGAASKFKLPASATVPVANLDRAAGAVTVVPGHRDPLPVACRPPETVPVARSIPAGRRWAGRAAGAWVAGGFVDSADSGSPADPGEYRRDS